MLRHVCCTFVVALLLAGGTARAEDPVREVELFNGRDFTGWTYHLDRPDVPLEAVWSVEEDGVLVCKGRPAGYLRTEKDDYSHYVLTLEWRWPGRGGNNGVLIHVSEPGALGVWPRSLEVQLAHENAGDFWVIPESTTIEIEDAEKRREGRRHLNLTDGSEKPLGEWNEMEITVRGGELIEVKVNGDLVNRATNCSETKGAIALQSEGTEIHYRNIKLRPL